MTAILALACTAAAQERPYAVVLAGEGGTYLKPPDKLDLALHPGEILFAGDRIDTGDPVRTTILLCPSGRVIDIPKGIAAEIGRNDIRIRGSARVSSRNVATCELPNFDRSFRAGSYHLGSSLFDQPGSQFNNAPIPGPGTEAGAVQLLNRLAVAERNKQEPEALAVSRTLASRWPNAALWKARMFVHGEAVASSGQPRLSQAGGTYAVVVGISKYRGPQSSQLDFAHRDAQMIYRYLTDPKGAAIPADHIRLLIDEAATVSAIRDAFDRLKSVRPATVVVFIAAHGMEAGNEAYVIAHDTNPQEPVATGIPMRKINEDITSQLAGVRTVFAWIDTCHSGQVAINGLDAPPNGVLFGYAASEPRKPSYEDPRLDGGHGVFSWYLNQALTGGIPGRSSARVYDLVDYVHDKVASFTGHDQIPQKFGNIDQRVSLASLHLGDTQNPLPSPAPQPQTLLARDFDSSDPVTDHENKGQDVILRYLDGDETPVGREAFLGAEAEFAAARQLAPESLWLEARESFCEGRVAVFDKRYDRAVALLDRAIQLDPSDALAYNALGVLWLERADYTRAQAAFDDAIRRAPGWAYAWHNRALAYTQAGNYSAAIRAYRHAMEIAPRYFYLPYNLGVLYQTLNRRRDAEASYLKAMSLKPNRAEPYNALGTLHAAEGKRDQAERDFRRALELDPHFAVAQQNLDTLLSQPGKRSRK